MSFLVCMVPVCPVRLQPSHKSEQVSQLLFGERCEWLEAADEFVRIKCVHDGYEGYCQLTQLVTAAEEGMPEREGLAADWDNIIWANGGQMHVPPGSVVPLSGSAQKKHVELIYKGQLIDATNNSFTPAAIKAIAFLFLNTAYLWGGRSVYGIDCSGFTQVVFKFFNIPLLRDAYQQATEGEAIGFLEEAKCGDLAFFDNAEKRITHVGIVLGDGSIIHASGKVRVDTLDNFGIVNTGTGKRTHNLRIIKRMADLCS